MVFSKCSAGRDAGSFHDARCRHMAQKIARQPKEKQGVRTGRIELRRGPVEDRFVLGQGVEIVRQRHVFPEQLGQAIGVGIDSAADQFEKALLRARASKADSRTADTSGQIRPPRS